jgi:uncharacterized repeat protein (TIGR01451 family)
MSIVPTIFADRVRRKLSLGCWLAAAALALAAGVARADSVGQVQTTKFFDPATVQTIVTRLQNSQPGFQVGDVISYIVQFTPIPNGANYGAGGYITDYIPAGTEVVAAEFVQPDGAGGYASVAAPQAPKMPSGWGTRGQRTYDADWTGLPGLTLHAACSTAGYTLANCNGRLSELHADTGIFFSTDPRTALYTYPSTDGRVHQGTNGYYITPTGAGNLNTILGQTNATTHNYWDAAMTNAFGSSAIPGLTPRATNNPIGTGQGAAPFNAGSPVAGPDTGYQLDYTGQVGPWRRIAYPGSMIGTTTNGPATAAGNDAVAVVAGVSTSAGWNLSSSNPLPSGTNAVRWAAGRLTVGTLNQVRISLRITSAPPAAGIINNTEVFGGDASNDVNGKGKDNQWRYHVPSVADNNSNLLILKQITGKCSGASLAAASACSIAAVSDEGALIPAAFVKLRYRITYVNSGNQTQSNVQITDQLPFGSTVQTLAAGNLYVASGQDLRPSLPAVSQNPAAAGAARGADAALTTVSIPTDQQTLLFQNIASLVPGAGGVIELDAVVAQNSVTALANGTLVRNTALISSAAIPAPGISSAVVSLASTSAFLDISKTVTPASAAPGGTVTYAITITNTGGATASSIVVRDFLPFSGTAADATRRFSYAAAVSTTGLTAVTPATAVPPTQTPYTGNANQQEVTWTFAGQTLAAGASATITFTATVGSAVPASAEPYTNVARVEHASGTATATGQAAVTVTSALSLTKSIECVYNGGSCAAYDGSGVVPSGATVRYKLQYANTGGSAHSSVYLCDQISSSQTSPAFSVAVTAGSAGTPPQSDAPSIGAPGTVGSPHVNCGFTSSANAFSYPVISSLAAGASGVVYFDAATNAANDALLTNTARIVSTESPGGAESTVVANVRDEARLTVTKATSTPTIATGGVATYTITLTNAGNQAAGNIDVYDFLPFTGTTADATRRFNYTATTGTTGLTGVTPATAAPPTQAGYSLNTNQQQVFWDFTTQTLAPGASATLTFTATAGANIPAGSTIYTNDVRVYYTNGSGGTQIKTAGEINAAPVTIPFTTGIAGRVFEDVNYGGGAGRAYSLSNGTAVAGARVELYGPSGFVSAATTNSAGEYNFTGLATNTYTVRVVNSTITSTRSGGAACVGTCLPVQTYRTNASSGAAVAVTDHVGGQNPAVADAAQVTVAGTALPANAQSITAAAFTAGGLISGVDFGFNFDTIVNVNNTGQGSLRQFITNANALAGDTSLFQSGYRTDAVTSTPVPLASATESTVFMIPDGNVHAGLNTGYASQLSTGVAVIPITTVLSTLSTSQNIEGGSQTYNVGNSNNVYLNAGGSVGASGTGFMRLNGPEVQLQDGPTGATGLLVGLSIQASNVTIRGLSVVGFGSTPDSDTHANILVGNFTGALISQNALGITAASMTDPGATLRSGGDSLRIAGGADTGSIHQNVIAFAAGNGIGTAASASTGWLVEYNEIRGNGVGNAARNGIEWNLANAINSVRYNLVAANNGAGIELETDNADLFTITQNTITGNGAGGTEPGGIRSSGGDTNTFSLNLIHGNTGPGIEFLTGASAATVSQNIIHSNTQSGIEVDNGADTITITQNSLYNNTRIGIDLLTSGQGATPASPYYTQNDNGDGDAGGNAVLNFPQITSVSFTGANITITGIAPAGAVVEIFTADGDATGFGEGQTYLASFTEGSGSDTAGGTGANTVTCGTGAVSVTMNNFSYTFPKPPTMLAGTPITTTATLGSRTSEFSCNATLVNANPGPTFLKTAALVCDPHNFTTNPKNIPGAYVRYTLSLSNSTGSTSTLNTISDVLTNSLLDPDLRTGTPAACESSPPMSAINNSLRVACSDTVNDCQFTQGSSGGAGVRYFTGTSADSDGVGYSGTPGVSPGTLTLNFATMGDQSLQNGATMTIIFNVIIQ